MERILDDVTQDFRDWLVETYSQRELEFRRARVAGRAHEARRIEELLNRDEHAYIACFEPKTFDIYRARSCTDLEKNIWRIEKPPGKYLQRPRIEIDARAFFRRQVQ